MQVKGPGFRDAAQRLARRAGGMVLDQLYPPACLSCDAPVDRAGGLCAVCWRQLRPITAPYCTRLGLPFEVQIGPDAVSAEAIARPPPFDRTRAAVVYNDLARALVSRLKYGDRPEIAQFLARMIVTGCAELFEDDAVLVPVPLHRWRQWRRRYNQSTELARAISHLTGHEVSPLLAMRQRRTRQQVGLSRDQRARNVAGAFAGAPDLVERSGGRRLVIVDDVVTTGATVDALTRALRRAGADKIDVVSFARVVIGPQMPI